MKKLCFFIVILALTVIIYPAFTQTRVISFGTTLNPQAQVLASQQLAKSLANPSSPQWQAKGDQHRTYHFAEANTEEPYRIYVPTNWDGKSKLPLVMFLHGAGSDENAYLDQNNKQLVNLAQQYGYLLVSPLGYTGAYGNYLRLSAPFGKPDEAAKLMAQVTAESERINQLSEKDVINVLELVLIEYPVDRAAMFLTGHSMGSGGTWLIGGKYPDYWNAIAPMSGPFVQETGYPWESIRSKSVYITEGTQAPSLDSSRLLRDWMIRNGFKVEYKEVNADHPGMVPLVLPSEFDFFNRCRTAIITPTPTPSPTPIPTATRITGDVNGDNNATIVDAMLIAQYASGKIPVGFIAANADVNCDNAINILDALQVARYAASLLTKLGC